jgi:GT2 family glycosyltransferase/glycosyltransferase involved in cell wall biosynthesis
LHLFVTYSGVLGGAERVLLDCASALAGESCLACPEGALAQAARAQGLRVFALPGRRLNLRASTSDRMLAPARLAGHAGRLRSLCHDLEPDLVVGWGMRSAIACVAAGTPGAAMAFAHNDLLPGPLIGAVVRLVAARAGAVIVPSRAVADDLDPRGRLGAKLHVVHPGVDLPQPAPGLPSTPPEVLVLGAIVGWKRPDLALQACALARRRIPQLRLRFVGAPLDGDDCALAPLRARADQPDLIGGVEFAGATADPGPDLARATCLLHCAPKEPFGLAVLEALAAGRPAIAPDAAGPKEIVDRTSGRLYAPGDAWAAADAIVEVVSDPQAAASMGIAGRRRARERFARASTRAGFAAAVAPLLRAVQMGATGTASPAPFALVTVTHNSAEHLRWLLASARRRLPGVRVIVVDCASEDASVEVARADDCAVSIALDENLGFGRACNRGLRRVHEPVTIFVNPDVELLDGSLRLLAGQLLGETHRRHLLAPLVLSSDGSRQDTVHPAPLSGADVARAVIPPAIVPGALAGPLAPWRAHHPRRVGWAAGCALGGRTETLLELGPFDPSIFMYGEDLELGLRASRHGIETWFWPRARVLHHSAHSSAKAFGGEPFALLASARHAAVERSLGSRRAAIDDGVQAVTFASRLAVKRAIGHCADRERFQLAALRRARHVAP